MPDYTKIRLTRMGGSYGSDNHTLIQSLVDNNPSKKIIIDGTVSDTVYISKPLVIPQNTRMVINATLKLTDGVIRSLTQDAATGQNRAYVDNSDGVYKVGHFLTVGAENYPTGGGGAVARKMGQHGKVTVATATYVEFENNFRTVVSGVSVGNLTVSNNATIGHAQTMLYVKNVDNVLIDGTGVVDGNRLTSHLTYHPCDMGSAYSSVAGYESSMGGNGIVFWNCDNITCRGLDSDNKIKFKEFNIGGILGVEINLYDFSNYSCQNSQYKGIAFSLGAAYGTCENIDIDTSINEDGISLHDNVTYTLFRNITIYNCPRIGLGVGAGSHHNRFETVSIDLCNLSQYSYIGPTDDDVHDNVFDGLTINRGIAGLTLGGVQNTTYNNLVITNGRAGNHCITVGGQCHDIAINTGGCYDTNLISSNSGWGLRTAAAEAYHDYTSYAITVDNFEFKRLNRGIVDQSGTALVTFTTCTLDDNDLNGDLASPDFTFVSCTVDGAPYP